MEEDPDDFDKLMQYINEVLSQEVTQDYTVQDVLILLLCLYVAYKLFKYISYVIKNRTLMSFARQVLHDRNSREYFVGDLSGVDIDEIIKMDVKKLREGMIKGRFTSL